jgi:TolB-like protein
MLLRFARFELDGARFELRENGAAVPVEPQVLSLLLLLAANRERLVTKDEIVDKVWNGRIVSESAVSSRVKTARRALGDDGRAQRMIRTIHGRGFRFVHAVQEAAPAEAVDAASPDQAIRPEPPARPSIAVLPFRLVDPAGRHAVLAEALPHDVIAELSRLRWLFIIARGSSFRFRADDPDIRHVGEVLGVRYCLTGTVEATGARLVVAVELADTRDCGIVWSERYEAGPDDIHDMRSRIVASLVAALEIRIPLHEAQAARTRAPEQLDAWSNYHLGLQRMFRFNRKDNEAAIALFGRAVAQEPDFARAYGGLSFAHFQKAFLSYSPDFASEAVAARRFAERAVEMDGHDPFANFALGRSHWLSGELETSLSWLDRAIALSPNYAQGIYSRAWTETLLGRGADGQGHVDTAIALSPIDPLHYAMLATRALSHLVRGEDAEAASWADSAARAPGAHVLIAVIAAACHAADGNLGKAGLWAANVKRRSPDLTRSDFFRSFPFADLEAKGRIAADLARLGI